MSNHNHRSGYCTDTCPEWMAINVSAESNTDAPVEAIFSFDTSKDWTPIPEYNLMFLRQVETNMHELLRSRKHVFLNEVFDALGIKRTSEGAIVLKFNVDGVIWDKIDAKPILTPSNAPVALVALLGDPSNECYIIKGHDEKWHLITSGDVVNDEDLQVGWTPYFANLEGFQDV